MRQIAAWMGEAGAAPNDEDLAVRVAGEVRELRGAFPPPGIPVR